jgi:hypothetical protein
MPVPIGGAVRAEGSRLAHVHGSADRYVRWRARLRPQPSAGIEADHGRIAKQL